MRFRPWWYEKFRVNVLCTCVGWERERELCVCLFVCVYMLRGGGIMRDEEKVGVIKGILVLNLSSDKHSGVFQPLRKNPLCLSAFTVGKIPEP